MRPKPLHTARQFILKKLLTLFIARIVLFDIFVYKLDTIFFYIIFGIHFEMLQEKPNLN